MDKEKEVKEALGKLGSIKDQLGLLVSKHREDGDLYKEMYFRNLQVDLLHCTSLLKRFLEGVERAKSWAETEVKKTETKSGAIRVFSRATNLYYDAINYGGDNTQECLDACSTLGQILETKELTDRRGWLIPKGYWIVYIGDQVVDICDNEHFYLNYLLIKEKL